MQLFQGNLLKLIVVFLLTTFYSSAQSYYQSPNDSLEFQLNLEEDAILSISQIHTTNDTLHFKWRKLSVDLPEFWEASICDNQNCYTSLLDSAFTLPVLPGDDGLLLIHCKAKVNTGTAIIRYTIFEVKNPESIDTLTYIFSYNALDLPNFSKQKLYFFNNTIYFNESVQKLVKVFDLIGNIVFESSLNSDQIISLDFLPSNFYFVQCETNSQILNHKICIQH